MNTTDPTLTRNIIETVAIAAEYCSFLESTGQHSQDDFFRSLRGLVPLLYLRGNLLPEISPENPEANERYVTEEQWDGLFTSLRKFLGEKDEFSYLSVNEYGQDAILRGSISEHLADIYQDLKDFVLLFKKPMLDARENAIYECKSLFQKNWGNRLANLLPVLHHIAVDNSGSELLNDFSEIL